MDEAQTDQDQLGNGVDSIISEKLKKIFTKRRESGFPEYRNDLLDAGMHDGREYVIVSGGSRCTVYTDEKDYVLDSPVHDFADFHIKVCDSDYVVQRKGVSSSVLHNADDFILYILRIYRYKMVLMNNQALRTIFMLGFMFPNSCSVFDKWYILDGKYMLFSDMLATIVKGRYVKVINHFDNTTTLYVCGDKSALEIILKDGKITRALPYKNGHYKCGFCPKLLCNKMVNVTRIFNKLEIPHDGQIRIPVCYFADKKDYKDILWECRSYDHLTPININKILRDVFQ